MAGMPWACAGIAQAAANTVDIAAFVKRDGFDDIEISPTGEYYAARVPGENSSALMIVRRADNTPMGGLGLGEDFLDHKIGAGANQTSATSAAAH